MNERIKELALEAFQPINDITPEGVADRSTFDQAWFQHYNQKFAELIILECEKVAKDPQWYSESPSNGWRNPINYVCKVMKEHFGVKP